MIEEAVMSKYHAEVAAAQQRETAREDAQTRAQDLLDKAKGRA